MTLALPLEQSAPSLGAETMPCPAAGPQFTFSTAVATGAAGEAIGAGISEDVFVSGALAFGKPGLAGASVEQFTL
jgi:hypothetical protein